MKIGFIGSHGTGKTTLARRLSSYLSLPLISETAREISTEFDLPLFPNNSLTTQRMIFLRQLKKELTYKEGVFDRTLLDNLAYLQKFLYVPNDLITPAEFNEMLSIACLLLKEYNYLFLCTISRRIGIAKDSVRDTNTERAMEIEHLIVNLLAECDCKYYILYEDDLELRFKKTLEVIKNGNY